MHKANTKITRMNPIPRKLLITQGMVNNIMFVPMSPENLNFYVLFSEKVGGGGEGRGAYTMHANGIHDLSWLVYCCIACSCPVGSIMYTHSPPPLLLSLVLSLVSD